MDHASMLELFKDNRDDGPLIGCFKHLLQAEAARQPVVARQLEGEYNKLLPQNHARGLVFTALTSANVLAELAKTRQEDAENGDGTAAVGGVGGEDEEEDDLEEETLMELAWGRASSCSFVLLRVLAVNGDRVLVQDAEGSSMLAGRKTGSQQQWSVGQLLVWSKPLVRVGPDCRATLAASSNARQLRDEERRDARYVRHPFVRGACDACGKCEEQRLVCGRCGIACYCSADCQKKSWPAHRQLCIPRKME